MLRLPHSKTRCYYAGCAQIYPPQLFESRCRSCHPGRCGAARCRCCSGAGERPVFTGHPPGQDPVWPGPGPAGAGLPCILQHPLWRSAGRRGPLAGSAGPGALGGSAGLHLPWAGSQSIPLRSVRCGGLPAAGRLYRSPRPALAGTGLSPQRRQPDWLCPGAAWSPPGGAGGMCGGVGRLPPGTAGVQLSPRSLHRCGCYREFCAAGYCQGAGLGAGEHCSFWRRPG